jgi:hypothetical protein
MVKRRFAYGVLMSMKNKQQTHWVNGFPLAGKLHKRGETL